MNRNGRSKEYWEARCAELEQALIACAEAFELVPIGAMEAQKTWFPSDVALQRIRLAKEILTVYLRTHSNGGDQAWE